MENTGIVNYSLDSLAKMNYDEEQGDHSYQGCFFAHRNSEFLRQMEIFRNPCRINAFIAILCIKGSAEIIFNMNRYTIKKNCFFISRPNNIFSIESWNDCEFYVTALDEDITKQMKIDYRKIIVVYLGMQKNPCIELAQDEVDSVSDTFHNLSGDINLFRRATYYDEIVLTSIILAAYKIFSILSEHQKRPENQMPNNLQEDYFNRFMELLDRNFRAERSIGFYASKICLTPKYLSSIVKKMSGKAAGEWIDDFVIMEVKSLLKFSKMSIQEIADYMNFPNQSFFAQYFKKHTGVNPSFYRNSQDFLQTDI